MLKPSMKSTERHSLTIKPREDVTNLRMLLIASFRLVMDDVDCTGPGNEVNSLFFLGLNNTSSYS